MEPGARSLVEQAEHARRDGRAAEAVQLARRAVEGAPHDVAARFVLGLALLDVDRVAEARHELGRLVPALLGEDDLGISRREGGADRFAARWDAPGAGPEPPALGEPGVVGESWLDPIDDESLDRAFAQAETQPELMRHADAVAEQALREVPVDLPDELLPSQGGSHEDDVLAAPGSPFATQSFAELLARQGHSAEAERVRSQLAASARLPGPPAGPDPRHAEPPDRPGSAPVPFEGFEPGPQPGLEPEPVRADTEREPGRATSAADRSAAAQTPAAPEAAGRQRARVLETLERWLENLRRSAA